jgi:hypothetical protein
MKPDKKDVGVPRPADGILLLPIVARKRFGVSV